VHGYVAVYVSMVAEHLVAVDEDAPGPARAAGGTPGEKARPDPLTPPSPSRRAGGVD
jgi:hypothetical protein